MYNELCRISIQSDLMYPVVCEKLILNVNFGDCANELSTFFGLVERDDVFWVMDWKSIARIVNNITPVILYGLGRSVLNSTSIFR